MDITEAIKCIGHNFCRLNLVWPLACLFLRFPQPCVPWAANPLFPPSTCGVRQTNKSFYAHYIEEVNKMDIRHGKIA